MRHVAVDGDRVVEALVALDELLDRDLGAVVDTAASDRPVELGGRVDARGARRAGAGGRLDDEREADLGDERADVVAGAPPVERGARHPGGAQRLLHRRLVAAQIGGAHARARDAARLSHVRRGHDVRLDRRLQPIDPHHPLDDLHGVVQLALVGDRADLLVVRQPALDVVVEPVLGSLADADHRRPRLGEGAGELLLVVGEARLEEDHVHVGNDVMARLLRCGAMSSRWAAR